MADGEQFLSDEDKLMIHSGPDYLAKQIEIAQAQIAHARATGSIALFADYLGLSTATGMELVDALKQRTVGLSTEASEKIINTFMSLIEQVPGLPEIPAENAIEQIPAPALEAAAQDIVSAPAVDIQPSKPVKATGSPSARKSVNSKKPTTKAQTNHTDAEASEIEQGVDSKKLAKNQFEYLKHTFGEFDEDLLSVDDAEKIANFLLKLRGQINARGANAFPYKEALTHRFKNMNPSEIGPILGRSGATVGVLLLNFRKAIEESHTPGELALLFTTEFTASAAEEVQKNPVAAAIVESPRPIPRPPVSVARPMPTNRSDRSRSEPTYGDVGDLMKTILNPKDEAALQHLRAYLSLNVGVAKTIKDGDINKVAWGIRTSLKRKYGTLEEAGLVLKLNKSEIVALHNVLGIIDRPDGGEDRGKQALSVAAYVHPEGKAVNFDREDATKSALIKLATGLAEGIKV